MLLNKKITALVGLCAVTAWLPVQAMTTSSVNAEYEFSITVTGAHQWVYDEVDAVPFMWHGTGADSSTKDSFDKHWSYPFLPVPAQSENTSWGEAMSSSGAGPGLMTMAAANLRAYPGEEGNPENPAAWELSGHALSSSSDAGIDADGGYSSRSMVERWGSILGNGSGSITITATPVNGGLSMDLSANEVNHDSYGGANVYNSFLKFNDVELLDESYQGIELKNDITNASLMDGNDSILEHTMTFGNGEYVQFFFGVNSLASVQETTVNPVPLPAAVWLFGSALLGFVGWQKRK